MTSNALARASVESPVTVDLPLAQVHVPCLTNVHAVQFRDYLLRHGVVVDAVDDTDVVIAYAGDLDFLQQVTTAAVLKNFADGAAMAAVLGVEEARLNGHLD